jgi:glycosyltransferase involved in cell wall biosynthesis
MCSHKIVLFANSDWYLYNFRLSLAQTLRRKGWEVVLISPPGEYVARLSSKGFRWIPVDFSTASTNPLAELELLSRIHRLYRAEKPDICHHFTIKCVLYGSLAARLAGVPAVVNAVTGMGHIFTDPGLKARLLRPPVRGLYRFALGRRGTRTIFQNDEDRGYFVRNRLVREETTALIRGSGVDCRAYRPGDQSDKTGGQLSVISNQLQASDHPPSTDHVKVLFASRLLREKGIFELLDAARALKAAGERIEFIFAGDIYPGNPSSLTADDLAAIRAEGLDDYRGHVDDMLPLLAESDIVVLPSYREGTPRILIEAAAMARPIVATDIAGCRGLVVHGRNGLLVPPRSVQPLIEALTTLARDPELREKMGKAGRRIVLEEFDEELVIGRTMEVYQAIWRDWQKSIEAMGESL